MILVQRLQSDASGAADLSCGGLSDAQVLSSHFDPKHALAGVTDEKKSLGDIDRACHRLPVTAALARDNRSHRRSTAPWRAHVGPMPRSLPLRG
jgi:hypothetical protein